MIETIDLEYKSIQVIDTNGLVTYYNVARIHPVAITEIIDGNPVTVYGCSTYSMKQLEYDSSMTPCLARISKEEYDRLVEIVKDFNTNPDKYHK